MIDCSEMIAMITSMSCDLNLDQKKELLNNID